MENSIRLSRPVNPLECIHQVELRLLERVVWRAATIRYGIMELAAISYIIQRQVCTSALGWKAVPRCLRTKGPRHSSLVVLLGAMGDRAPP